MRSILAAKKEYDALCMPGKSFRKWLSSERKAGRFWYTK